VRAGHKDIVGTTDMRLPLEELRRHAGESADTLEVRGWLRDLADVQAPAGSAGRDPVGSTELSTAFVGLHELARAVNLERCLIDAFGQDGPALLYLAMHQTVRGEPLYLAEAWLSDLWLPACLMEFDFSSGGLSRLTGRIGRDEAARQSFFAAWMAARRHPRALIYDTTSISTYAADLEAACFGHNRDHENLPQENLALVCDRADGMPLFCRLLPGSVPDVVTLEATARILRALGLKDSEFVLDRGFYSNSNLRDLLLGGHHFTIGALLACRQSREPFRRASLAQGLQLINRYRRSLNSPKRSIFHEGRTVRHVQDRWIVDMGRDGRGKRREGQAVEAHIFFDPRRHADRVAQLDERVFALEEKAASEHFADRAETGRWLTENAAGLGSCLRMRGEPGGDVLLRRRPRAIAARTANAGFQIVICDVAARDPVSVLSDYPSRDRAEKLFDLLKNEDGQYRLRTGRQAVAEGRILLGFLALVLRTELENRMRTAGLLKRASTAEFLAEMGRIRAIRLADGTRLVREVTRRHREWLQAAGLQPPQA
jgi:hypothetical protein